MSYIPTVINNPPSGTSDNGNESSLGTGIIVGSVIVIGILLVIFFYVGIGQDSGQQSGDTNNAPVAVPDKVDINLESDGLGGNTGE